jgi:argininosuccinate lyase
MRNTERLKEIIPCWNQCPLGSSALAGNAFPSIASFLPRILALVESRQTPSIPYVVCDHDFVVEYLMWSTLLLTHFSQFAEDVIITNLLKGVDRKRRGQACQRKGCCRTEDRREEGHDTS